MSTEVYIPPVSSEEVGVIRLHEGTNVLISDLDRFSESDIFVQECECDISRIRIL